MIATRNLLALIVALSTAVASEESKVHWATGLDGQKSIYEVLSSEGLPALKAAAGEENAECVEQAAAFLDAANIPHKTTLKAVCDASVERKIVAIIATHIGTTFSVLRYIGEACDNVASPSQVFSDAAAKVLFAAKSTICGTPRWRPRRRNAAPTAVRG